jgi:hypothetical protein
MTLRSKVITCKAFVLDFKYLTHKNTHFFINTYYTLKTPKPNTNGHDHAHKYCAMIEPAISGALDD